MQMTITDHTYSIPHTPAISITDGSRIIMQLNLDADAMAAITQSCIQWMVQNSVGYELDNLLTHMREVLSIPDDPDTFPGGDITGHPRYDPHAAESDEYCPD